MGFEEKQMLTSVNYIEFEVPAQDASVELVELNSLVFDAD